MGVGHVMLVSDPGVVEAGITGRIKELIEDAGVEVEAWDACASSRRRTPCGRRRISLGRATATGSWRWEAGPA